LGKVVEKVPHSIVVGFTIGIAIVIAMSQIGEILGSKQKVGYGIILPIQFLVNEIGAANIFAVLLALITFVICKGIIKNFKLCSRTIDRIGIWLYRSQYILVRCRFNKDQRQVWKHPH
jgi:MFS superfamily sulfate permease-like transporter